MLHGLLFPLPSEPLPLASWERFRRQETDQGQRFQGKVPDLNSSKEVQHFLGEVAWRVCLIHPLPAGKR